MSAALTRMPGTLHDRLDEVAVILATLEALEGNGSPEVQAALEQDLRTAISGTREKIDRTACALSSFEAAEDHVVKEIARLAARQARLARQRERLESYVIGVLVAAGVKKLDGFTGTLAVRANPVSIVIEDTALLPAECLRLPKLPDPAPDKGAIKAELGRGEFVPGCRLAQTVRLVLS